MYKPRTKHDAHVLAWALFGRYWFVQVVEKSLSANGSDTKYRAFYVPSLTNGTLRS